VAFAGSGAGLVKGGRLVFLFPTFSGWSFQDGLPVPFDVSGGGSGEGVDEEAARQRRREQLVLALPRHPALRQGLSRRPDCLLVRVVFQCTRTHSPHPPPRCGHSFPDCLLKVYPYTLAASSSPDTLVHTVREQTVGIKCRSDPTLRLVSLCAQEFKGMSRHAVVMERV